MSDLHQGIAFILGNNLAGRKVDIYPELQVIDEPEQLKFQGTLEMEPTDIYLACVITRSAAHKARNNEEMKKIELSQFNDISPQAESLNTVTNDMSQKSLRAHHCQLMTDQKNDPELCSLADEAFSSEEASDVATYYYDSVGVLMMNGDRLQH